MKAVNIIPTMETSFGIEDRYNIVSNKTNFILYKNVPQSLLEKIIKENEYKVINGEKHL